MQYICNDIVRKSEHLYVVVAYFLRVIVIVMMIDSICKENLTSHSLKVELIIFAGNIHLRITSL